METLTHLSSDNWAYYANKANLSFCCGSLKLPTLGRQNCRYYIAKIS
jgi:hypothetical protein